ncbi:hypothetical protein Bbelb_406110 [Branchiostoma belcheri]|nr:hypothetical protein Bbelb_406110 [Branchiostoma belcheri]
MRTFLRQLLQSVAHRGSPCQFAADNDPTCSGKISTRITCHHPRVPLPWRSPLTGVRGGAVGRAIGLDGRSAKSLFVPPQAPDLTKSKFCGEQTQLSARVYRNDSCVNALLPRKLTGNASSADIRTRTIYNNLCESGMFGDPNRPRNSPPCLSSGVGDPHAIRARSSLRLGRDSTIFGLVFALSQRIEDLATPAIREAFLVLALFLRKNTERRTERLPTPAHDAARMVFSLRSVARSLRFDLQIKDPGP